MLLNKVSSIVEAGVTDSGIGLEYENQYRYIYIGHDSSFVPSILKYDYFTPAIYMKYFRNVPRIYSTPKNINLNFSVYWGSYEQDWMAVYTTTSTNYLFGQSFSNPHYFAYLDLQNNKIIAENETRDRKPGNEFRPVYYRNITLNDKHFVVMFNALTLSTVVPYYEQLLNPYSFVSGYQYIYKYLKDHGSFEFYPSAYIDSSLPQHYTVYNPKVMIFYQSVFYNFDGTSFKEFDPANEYLTIDELSQNGITLFDYNQIPEQAFKDLLQKDNLFGEKIQIITNGYVIPTVLRSDYWLDKYQESYFMWTVVREQKVLFIPGLI